LRSLLLAESFLRTRGSGPGPDFALRRRVRTDTQPRGGAHRSEKRDCRRRATRLPRTARLDAFLLLFLLFLPASLRGSERKLTIDEQKGLRGAKSYCSSSGAVARLRMVAWAVVLKRDRQVLSSREPQCAPSFLLAPVDGGPANRSNKPGPGQVRSCELYALATPPRVCMNGTIVYTLARSRGTWRAGDDALAFTLSDRGSALGMSVRCVVRKKLPCTRWRPLPAWAGSL